MVIVEPEQSRKLTGFAARHIGPQAAEAKAMLAAVGYASLDEMMRAVVPEGIRLGQSLNLPSPCAEAEALQELRSLAEKNRVFRSYIGMGYSDCLTPAVLQRNLLENPGWYTQYTPYQAEIAQGRLEALLNFQTMIMELTALDVANASLLDEATAAAEAMTMCHGLKEARTVFLVADTCHPQNIEVVKARAAALGLTIRVGAPEAFVFDDQVFGILLQYPDTFGRLLDYTALTEQAHAAGALVVVAADLLSLTLLRPPGEFGADIAVGSAQRFGVPLGFGGPHAAYMAVRDTYKRHMPGRIVGVSRDARGRPALRLSLQTREQHIRREKATSNICTAQALLANVASMYACYHGPEGLCAIAKRVRGLTHQLAATLCKQGCEVQPAEFFDTITLNVGEAAAVHQRAEALGINFRRIDDHRIGIALDETTSETDLADIVKAIVPASAGRLETVATPEVPAAHARRSPGLRHPVFSRYHSETEMMRYLKRLENRDLSLTTSMIPLGSCTMKLNAAVQMYPISWPEFNKLHPFAPATQTAGYQELFRQLESWLSEITGFAGVSLQPNAGSQGEYAGLLVIRAYHRSRGAAQRQVCLIPTSAHGTNPASAVMAGMQVVAVACDKQGNVDLADLRQKVQAHQEHLAALMVTYPSTHGVFEESIREICEIVHAGGGQVYMDGANLNAQVGWCRPGDMGADVCHMNLHKTFCIPHGGGGPGMGPIAVAAHLKPFLPGHGVAGIGTEQAIPAVSAAPWGSASILPISWVYIRLMGAAGLRDATAYAILNANYIAQRLGNHFPVLYRGKAHLVAHECILDLRAFKATTVEDVAKRLMDYGFHAPTISWPVGGTMMVEPTESENKAELDRFCDALVAIHAEMLAVESGAMDKANNPLKHAPHTAEMVVGDWNRPYTREQACFPVAWVRENKFWPAVARIDNVYGDRNLVCSCVGMEAYTK
jgi:glycine dehydrogenase